MRVSQVMPKQIEFIDRFTPVSEIAQTMRLHDIGLLPVVDNNNDGERRLVGVVTDRDLTLRCAAEQRDPALMEASECMTPNPVVCHPEDTLEQALELMVRGHVRRLPVVESNRQLCSVLSIGDVLRSDAVGPAKMVAALRKIYAGQAKAKAA